MKKFLFLMLSLFIFASCEDECNFCGSNDCDGECQNVAPQPDIEELIVGDWVYVDTKNHIWEKQSLLSNMKLYFSGYGLDPYLWIENAAGTYYFTSDNNKMSLVYDNVLGGKTYQDYEITEINKYSYTAKSYTDNGIYGGTFTYNRVIDEIELEFGETATPRYGTLTSNIDIQYYFSNNEDIATVNASTGKIKAGNVAGLTYINVVTAEGNALIEVKVIDPDNLFPDYSPALNMTLNEAKQSYGAYNQNYYSYALLYLITGNEYAKTAYLLHENGNIVQVSIELKDQISYTEKDIHKFLSSKYTYQYQTDGMYMYFDLSQPEILPMVIYYAPEDNFVYYLKVNTEATEDLWPDYSEEFGKTMDEIKEKYGTPYYVGTYYSYFFVENDYINDVGFSTNESTNLVDAAVAFLETNCDKEKALDFIKSKYYYYSTNENGEPIYIDSSNGLYDARLAILYNEEYGYFLYMQLSTSRSAETKAKMLKKSIKTKSIERPQK